jgi:hypothetical protein
VVRRNNIVQGARIAAQCGSYYWKMPDAGLPCASALPRRPEHGAIDERSIGAVDINRFTNKSVSPWHWEIGRCADGGGRVGGGVSSTTQTKNTSSSSDSSDWHLLLGKSDDPGELPR